MTALSETDASYHPSADEVAAWTRTRVAQVRRALGVDAVVPIGVGGAHASLDTSDGETDSVTSAAPMTAALSEFGLTVLEPCELFVIVRRYGLDGAPGDRLEDLGPMLGVTPDRVREIEAAALSKLQHCD